MLLPITQEHVPYIEKWLEKSLPDVRNELRRKALCRGLRFRSVDGMTKLLGKRPSSKTINEDAFQETLAENGAYAPDKLLTRVLVRAMVELVLENDLELTTNGFWNGEYNAKYEKYRDDFFSNDTCDEILACLVFLDQCEKIKTINMSITTYGLKHMVEDFRRRIVNWKPGVNCYVSNGAFIAAADIRKFKLEKVDSASPNAYINISNKSVKNMNNLRNKKMRGFTENNHSLFE